MELTWPAWLITALVSEWISTLHCTFWPSKGAHVSVRNHEIRRRGSCCVDKSPMERDTLHLGRRGQLLAWEDGSLNFLIRNQLHFLIFPNWCQIQNRPLSCNPIAHKIEIPVQGSEREEGLSNTLKYYDIAIRLDGDMSGGEGSGRIVWPLGAMDKWRLINHRDV